VTTARGLTTITDPFRDPDPFYTGTGTTTAVPEGWPVAINGHGYMIDLASDQFRRGFEERIRASTDQGGLPGEATISPQGLWRRSQTDWHLGAGQEWADDAETQPGRYWKSKGIDVWNKGGATLLNEAVSVQATGESKPFIAQTVNRVWIAYGQTVKFASLGADLTSGGSWTTCTGGYAGTITGIAAANDTLHVAYTSASDTYKVTDSGSALSAYCTDPMDGVGFVKNRLMAWNSASLYNIIAAGAAPTPLRTLNVGSWIGVAAGPQHIYAAASNGIVYRITITDDATSLGAPTVAGELPASETLRTIDSYLGFLLLGTSKGARFCTSDDNGNLVIGPLVSTGSQNVRCFGANERYVWFGWPNYDGSSGLGRMDLAVFTTANAPAYATDLMVNGQTADTWDIEIINGKPFFSIAGVGYYVQGTNKVASGTLETGKFSFGIPDTKVIAKLDVRTAPLEGTVDTEISLDEAAYQGTGEALLPGGTLHEFTVNTQTSCYQAGFRFTLNRDTTDATTGPTLLRWNVRTFVAPARSQVVIVPVLLHSRLIVNEEERYCDVTQELIQLRSLVTNPRIVTYQDVSGTYDVLVEDVLWTPDNNRDISRVWDGTATVSMRTITA
jgi:hypothetical protein